MKEEIKAISRHKFRTWRHTFAVFFTVFLLSFILGAVIYSNSHPALITSRLARLSAIMSLSLGEIYRHFLHALIMFFLLFTFGPTIYAPVASALTVILTGLVSGAECSYLFEKGRWATAGLEIIFSSAVNYLMILYATMVTLTALRIFTDEKNGSSHEIFEGSLFCAKGFRGIFNYRYVLSYICFYVFISLVAAGVIFLRALAVMLV